VGRDSILSPAPRIKGPFIKDEPKHWIISRLACLEGERRIAGLVPSALAICPGISLGATYNFDRYGSLLFVDSINSIYADTKSELYFARLPFLPILWYRPRFYSFYELCNAHSRRNFIDPIIRKLYFI
jgi:hypothetical protein